VHHKRVILMQEMQNFSGEGAQPPPQTPPQWREGHPLPTPHPPWRLDLNPSHSEILPYATECPRCIMMRVVCGEGIMNKEIYK